jgi:hypothetical protein
MPNTGTITKKQRAVIEDLFTGRFSEEDVLERHGVRRRVYYKWHTMANFAAEYKRRLKLAKRESEMIITSFAPVAAGKLIQLTQSKNAETARKACLDVINFRRKARKNNGGKKVSEAEKLPELSPELASRLLAALAKDGKQKPIQK